MERAAELLQSGKYNVTEAAMAVGYSSLSHFSQSFCQTMGCCPGLYPNRRRPGKQFRVEKPDAFARRATPRQGISLCRRRKFLVSRSAKWQLCRIAADKDAESCSGVFGSKWNHNRENLSHCRRRFEMSH